MPVSRALPHLVVLGGGLALALPLAVGDAQPSSSRTRPPYRTSIVARSLVGAVQVATAPGDRRLYVVQRRGLVKILERGRALPQPFLDLRGHVSVEGERGLLAVAFHPDYDRNRRLYAFYTEDPHGEIAIVEYRSDGSRVDRTTSRMLVRVPHADSPYHNGGMLAFGPDGRLYAGIGDGGYLLDQPRMPPDPRGNSQNLDVLLGKIFAIDVEESNPRPKIVAYGLRNPWRFAFDPVSGDLLIGDVGFTLTEEIDVLRRSAVAPVNFGWSVYEARRRRRTDVTLNPAGPLVWPTLTYGLGSGNCAVIGGVVYHGSIQRLRGRFVFGDHCSGRVWSVVIRNGRAGRLRSEHVRLAGLTSFATDSRGELYATTLGGRVVRFTRM